LEASLVSIPVKTMHRRSFAAAHLLSSNFNRTVEASMVECFAALSLLNIQSGSEILHRLSLLQKIDATA
jgi:hypothetical protein